MEKYVAFLRGINVSGHHKVPMAELKTEMEELGFRNSVTLLNSGNVVFDADESDSQVIETKLSSHLESTFGFPIPTMVRTADQIRELLTDEPFKDEVVTKDIRLYVSFLRQEESSELAIPWTSDDRSFRILEVRDRMVLSVLDVAVTGTPKAMEVLERNFSKDITTRNWNTIIRIGEKL